MMVLHRAVVTTGMPHEETQANPEAKLNPPLYDIGTPL